jgi:hypothetical protein
VFYTYLWLRENGTPYYVGKGKGNRAYINHYGRSSVHKAPPNERIVVYPAQSENDAFETEVALIWYYGRKDLWLGCLRNLTNGGEKPPPGHRCKPHSNKTKALISKKNKGRKRSPEVVEKHIKRMLGTQYHLRTDMSTEDIVRRYTSGESIEKLAKVYGTYRSTVRRRLRKSGIKTTRRLR